MKLLRWLKVEMGAAFSRSPQPSSRTNCLSGLPNRYLTVPCPFAAAVSVRGWMLCSATPFSFFSNTMYSWTCAATFGHTGSCHIPWKCQWCSPKFPFGSEIFIVEYEDIREWAGLDPEDYGKDQYASKIPNDTHPITRRYILEDHAGYQRRYTMDR